MYAPAPISMGATSVELLPTNAPSPIEVGCPAYRGDMGGGNRLEPDGLPDACCAMIPDTMRLLLPVLLAARLGQVMRHIFGSSHNHLLLPWPQRRRDVRAERRLPAFVRCHRLPIHPYLRPVIDRPKMEQQPLASISRRSYKCTAIPHDGMKAWIDDATGG